MLRPIIEGTEYLIYQSTCTGKFFLDDCDCETIIELEFVRKEPAIYTKQIEEYTQDTDIVTFDDEHETVYWFNYVE